MFHRNIEVNIPNKKRVRKNGGPFYVYEILSRKNKKHKEKVVCVGVLNKEQTKMHPNNKYYELHKERITEDSLLEVKEFDNQIHLGAEMVLRKIAEDEGLSTILNECFDGRSNIILSLVDYFLIRRDSSAQLFKYFLRDHYTDLNYIPSETELSNLFNDFFNHENISNFLTRWMNYRVSNKKHHSYIDIDFDSTNRNVSSKSIGFAEFGKAKVDEGLPQVNTAYFLDRESGLPIYYDIYYGSIIDMSHCQVALEKIKAVNKSIKGMIVMDRGYFSNKNIEYFEKNKFSFLCMGKDNKVFSDLINTYPRNEISEPKNRVYKTIYGLKLVGKPFETTNKNYHIYLYYNESDVAYEASRIQDEVEYCAKFLVGKKDKDKQIENTFGKRINLTYDDERIIIKAEPNYTYLKNRKNELGYFWIVSNVDDTCENILLSYRHRDLIEKQMKYSKSLADLDKLFAQSDNAYEAKTLLSFISAILRSIIVLKIKPYVLQYSNETSQTVLLELDKIKVEEINDSYILRYALTSKQKQILSLFDLTLRNVLDYSERINFNKNITSKK